MIPSGALKLSERIVRNNPKTKKGDRMNNNVMPCVCGGKGNLKKVETDSEQKSLKYRADCSQCGEEIADFEQESWSNKPDGGRKAP